MVCFWHKISTGLNTKLSYKLLYLLKNLDNENQYSSPWLKNIERILNSCNMTHVWLNPNLYQLSWLKKEIMQKLTDSYKQNWLNEINVKRSCRTYKTFKPYPKLEKYLLLPDSTDRINISKFRCRNSNLPVVTLRYEHLNIPYENRTCTLCTMGVVGDEFHYILQCPFFQVQRQGYLENHFLTNPNRETFSELFQTENFSTLRKLSKFIIAINGSLR